MPIQEFSRASRLLPKVLPARRRLMDQIVGPGLVFLGIGLADLGEGQPLEVAEVQLARSGLGVSGTARSARMISAVATVRRRSLA